MNGTPPPSGSETLTDLVSYSYWGASMHQINTAAGFIKGNSPLGMVAV